MREAIAESGEEIVKMANVTFIDQNEEGEGYAVSLFFIPKGARSNIIYVSHDAPVTVQIPIYNPGYILDMISFSGEIDFGTPPETTGDIVMRDIDSGNRIFGIFGDGTISLCSVTCVIAD